MSILLSCLKCQLSINDLTTLHISWNKDRQTRQVLNKRECEKDAKFAKNLITYAIYNFPRTCFSLFRLSPLTHTLISLFFWNCSSVLMMTFKNRRRKITRKAHWEEENPNKRKFNSQKKLFHARLFFLEFVGRRWTEKLGNLFLIHAGQVLFAMKMS
jgi:hypothetical protein